MSSRLDTEYAQQSGLRGLEDSSQQSSCDQKSLFYNEMIALKKTEYRVMVDMLKHHIQAQEDEKLLLDIKVCLKNKSTLIAGTGNNYFIL